ncbi:hypothetical protein HZH68_016842 [Vespula germanica]|uniref:Uncharacterized protein n=1 Tax=Vespula germanica TaxID=30212 RepID=A0A834MQG0_VESGE|nr:hypothetical protein HZH68_016842 [Vespula germanica]
MIEQVIIVLPDEIRNDKKNLREINDDSTKENLLIDAGIEEEEEKKNKKEEVEDEGKDYEPTLVYDSIDDRFYFDNDDFIDKLNSI